MKRQMNFLCAITSIFFHSFVHTAACSRVCVKRAEIEFKVALDNPTIKNFVMSLLGAASKKDQYTYKSQGVIYQATRVDAAQKNQLTELCTAINQAQQKRHKSEQKESRVEAVQHKDVQKESVDTNPLYASLEQAMAAHDTVRFKELVALIPLADKKLLLNMPNTRTGNTLLHGAVLSNSLEIVQFLLEQNVQDSLCHKNADSETPLHSSIRRLSLPLFKALIEHGSQESFVSFNHAGETPLHYAVLMVADYAVKSKEEPMAMVKLLLERGGGKILFSKCKTGCFTPEEVASMLLSRGSIDQESGTKKALKKVVKMLSDAAQEYKKVRAQEGREEAKRQTAALEQASRAEAARVLAEQRNQRRKAAREKREAETRVQQAAEEKRKQEEDKLRVRREEEDKKREAVKAQQVLEKQRCTQKKQDQEKAQRLAAQKHEQEEAERIAQQAAEAEKIRIQHEKDVAERKSKKLVKKQEAENKKNLALQEEVRLQAEQEAHAERERIHKEEVHQAQMLAQQQHEEEQKRAAAQEHKKEIERIEQPRLTAEHDSKMARVITEAPAKNVGTSVEQITQTDFVVLPQAADGQVVSGTLQAKVSEEHPKLDTLTVHSRYLARLINAKELCFDECLAGYVTLLAFQAAVCNNQSAVKALATIAELDMSCCRDIFGYTLPMVAIQSGHLEMFNLLINQKRGSWVKSFNKDFSNEGESLATIAARCYRETSQSMYMALIINELLDAGADFMAPDLLGRTGCSLVGVTSPAALKEVVEARIRS